MTQAADVPPAGPAAPGKAVRVRLHRDEPPRFYQALLGALSDLGEGVVVLDREQFVFVNDAFCRMVARERRELLSPALSVRSLFAPEARDTMEEHLRRRLSGESAQDHYEGILLRGDGARLHVEISVRTVSHDGRALRFAVIRDVTLRKLGERDLERARLELAKSEKLAALGTLVSGVAHEVRTPLVYIENNLHLIHARLERLRRGEIAPEDALREIDDCFAMASEGVERANRLVRDLARFTRLPTEPTMIDLASVVDEAISLFRATHPAMASGILAQLEPAPPIRADASKIQQVVLNLLANAHDAQPQGGAVRVSTHAVPGGAVLRVSDDGPGIAQSEIARIFDPLYTTKPGGMGLGLSIVRRIVELHRGTIHVDSSPGAGTSFAITLAA